MRRRICRKVWRWSNGVVVSVGYAASCENWANGQNPGVSWPFRIMLATSIPYKVAEADANDLIPRIGLTRFLLQR